MGQEELKISDHLLVETSDEGFVLKARDEVGRGKRFGMSGEIELNEQEADRLAKWVFARDIA